MNKKIDLSFLNKPIGINSKNYGFMEAMLHKNIGSHRFEFDGYGTILGMGANPYYNENINPWFIMDENRKKYGDYLSYLNKTYFHGTMRPPIFCSHSEQIRMFDFNILLEEKSRVGAIHNYNIDNILSANLLIPNGATNPNGYDDTRLGVINNFYLSATLNNSYKKMLLNDSSSYNPYDEERAYYSSSISQGIYSKFGLKGEFGINDGTFHLRSGVVTPNDVFLPYDVKYYKQFGNFYDINNSLELFDISGGRTKDYIAKSIYGIDLLSDKTPSLLFDEGINGVYEKKYYASISSRGTNYIDMMTNEDVSFLSTAKNDLEIIRLELNDPGNDNYSTFNTFLTYAEANKNGEAPAFFSPHVGNSGVNVGKYEAYDGNIIDKKDIIAYTNEQFKKNKFKTIISRFHTDEFDDPMDAKLKKEQTSSAISQYGMSHGRNLLKLNHKDGNVNGYHDPYCRTWTYHKQYQKYHDLIRPFSNENREDLNNLLSQSMQPNRNHLIDNGVKNKESGLVRFAPDSKEMISKCMFSIENLAWKGDKLLDKYTKGPLGGRIMWFPPYGLTFNENVSTNWNGTQFIGRGEKIYTYVDTERSGNLGFNILIDHPSLINKYHNVTDSLGDVDDVQSYEQSLLRFFAGCGILDDINDGKNKKEEEKKKPATELPIIENMKIVVDVFFPNLYSGVKDDPIEAINYLCSGIGSQIMSLDYRYYNDKNEKQQVGGYETRNIGLTINTKSEVVFNGYQKFILGGENKTELKIKSEKVSDNSNNYWGYRVDEKQVLQENNYGDTTSYQLNYNKTSYIGAETFSFIELASFMNNGVLSHYNNINSNSVKKLQHLFDEMKVIDIDITGYSNNMGNSDKNEKLAKNRCKTIEKWLRTNNIFKGVSIKSSYEGNVKVSGTDINSKEAKEARKVRIIFNLQKFKFNEIRLPKEIAPLSLSQSENMSDLAKIATQNVKEREKKISQLQEDLMRSKSANDNISYNEYDYFKQLASFDTLLHHKIVDKIKFFDPAFHSITPEGFNERLTFLHQCTRQGNTESLSDNGKNIRNLSFGAPPICVLRIGDFYNTKIIIDGLQISYDETMWDLNDEGIGVMPMVAKIDISFKFIGGSDLQGPI